MGDKSKISKSKAILFVVITAIVSIVATAYLSNYFQKHNFKDQVYTSNAEEAKYNIRIARKLRDGETEKLIDAFDVSIGGNAIAFSNYKKYAPKNLHKDILETLQMIKAYLDEYKIKSDVVNFQKDVDESLAQINEKT